jgi:glycosyltransferase involved in cell wall biosynthesis
MTPDRLAVPPLEPAIHKIRVLHLLYTPGFGGIESIVLEWWKQFDRSLFEIHVAVFTGDRDRERPFLEAANAIGMETHPVPWSKWKPFLRCARAVVDLCRKLKIDIIHTHAYYGDAVGALAGKLGGIPTIATVYVWGKYEFHRQLMQLMDWTSLQFVTKVTAHCRDTARKTWLLGRKGPVPVLFPGYPKLWPPVKGEAKLARRRAAGVADDEILLVNAARLAPEKAQDQLLRSFAKIHARFPKSRLWISGVGLDHVETDLRRIRRELGLEQAAELIGFREDFRGLLDLADMMVHPSHVEGIPQSIMGGMAAGLPIVASDVGGVSEVIRNGETGVLVAENDEEGFAAAVIRLLENPEEARRLGEAARQAIDTELSTEVAVRRVERTYREMLGRESS